MRNIVIVLFSCFVFACTTKKQPTANTDQTHPKLVVGIVVDQMRYDYLTRFKNKFGNNGFKRLQDNGFNLKNHHFNYVPTYTGPGHASIYTGTTPMNHGIIANHWYDKDSKKGAYCAGDSTVSGVGVRGKSGQMSPIKMRTTSVTDQLKLHTQHKSNVIGISLKDRGAILPAGHTANAAYWFEGNNEGKFITSTYYTDKLPAWVTDFNNTVDVYMKEWNTILPIEQYTESGMDDNHFEATFKGNKHVTFPYDLKELSKKNGGYSILKATPFGNNLVTDFAIAAIKNENLGADNVTDFLAISYSSPDYVGHQFGVNSIEVEDTYIRLDADIEKLLNHLDTTVGKGEYTVFLTADHGAIHVPNYLKSKKIPAGYFNKKAFREKLAAALDKRYKVEGLIENISNNQVFLNSSLIEKQQINMAEIQAYIVQQIIKYPNISKAFTAHAMSSTQFTSGVAHLLQNGYHQKYSGDVLFVLAPSVISYPEKGSTHGSSFSYDTHVPLLFYGAGIKKGTSIKRTEVIDIAPTISVLLGISFPNGCTGNPLEDVLE